MTEDPSDPLAVEFSDFEAFDMEKPPFLYPGVYCLINSEGHVIYIGESGHVPQRLKQHRRSKKWWGDVSSVRVLWASDPDKRLCAETKMILRLRPRHNRAVKVGLNATGVVYPLNFIRSSKKRAKS